MATERITRADVARIAGTVSEGLADGFAIVPNGRNGYVALDLYRGADCVEMLFAGTARETYTYLQGWRQSQLRRRKGE